MMEGSLSFWSRQRGCGSGVRLDGLFDPAWCRFRGRGFETVSVD